MYCKRLWLKSVENGGMKSALRRRPPARWAESVDGGAQILGRLMSLRSLGKAHRWGLVGSVGSMGSDEFLWVSVVILNAVKNLSGCDWGRAFREILRIAQDDRCGRGKR